MHRKAKTGE